MTRYESILKEVKEEVAKGINDAPDGTVFDFYLPDEITRRTSERMSLEFAKYVYEHPTKYTTYKELYETFSNEEI